jgi:hypothetical protein
VPAVEQRREQGADDERAAQVAREDERDPAAAVRPIPDVEAQGDCGEIVPERGDRVRGEQTAEAVRAERELRQTAVISHQDTISRAPEPICRGSDLT